jgi:hypothetical protein
MRKHTSTTPQVRPHHRHSLRNGFNDCFVLSPVSMTSESPSLLGKFPRSLAPAQGRQDHTTWPSATLPIVERKKHSAVSRPPHPAPRIVTIRAKRPSCRDETVGRYAHLTNFRKRNFRVSAPEQRHASESSRKIHSRAQASQYRFERRVRRNSGRIDRTDLPVGQITLQLEQRRQSASSFTLQSRPDRRINKLSWLQAAVSGIGKQGLQRCLKVSRSPIFGSYRKSHSGSRRIGRTCSYWSFERVTDRSASR